MVSCHIIIKRRLDDINIGFPVMLLALLATLLAGCAHAGSSVASNTAFATLDARTSITPATKATTRAATGLAGSRLAFSGAHDLALNRAKRVGHASYYGRRFAGNLTASGERFDPSELTAAHRTLPFGTRVLVTNLDNGRHVTVRINDRGPFVASRIIDLSRRAARRLGMLQAGIAEVRLQVLGQSSS